MLSYFIHDERYLEIQELMEEFTDMSYGEVQLYESVVSKIRNRDKEKIWDKNQSVMVNVVNLVSRLIKECKNLILKILNSIKNAVDYVFLKKEDKERYAQYEAYLKTHPAYKRLSTNHDQTGLELFPEKRYFSYHLFQLPQKQKLFPYPVHLP